MCFSATASFVAGGILIPLGGFALVQAWKTDRRYLTFSAFPALFGIQQIFEGFVWRSMDDPGVPASHVAAMAFLLFAYLLWPVLTPLAVFLIEDRAWLRRLFLGVTVFGAAYGLLLFAPLVVNSDWLSIELARNSILYNPQPIYGDLVSNTVLRVTYAAVICLPLLVSTAPGVRTFGGAGDAVGTAGLSVCHLRLHLDLVLFGGGGVGLHRGPDVSTAELRGRAQDHRCLKPDTPRKLGQAVWAHKSLP